MAFSEYFQDLKPTVLAITELNYFKGFHGLPIQTIMNMSPFIQMDGKPVLILEYPASIDARLIQHDIEKLGVTVISQTSSAFLGVPGMGLINVICDIDDSIPPLEIKEVVM